MTLILGTLGSIPQRQGFRSETHESSACRSAET